MRGPIALLAVALIASGATANDAAPDGTDAPFEPRVVGRIAASSLEGIDWLGDMSVDFPFRVSSDHGLFVAADTRTVIAGRARDLTFELRDVLYGVGVGWRGRFRSTPGAVWSAAVRQRGFATVDAEGEGWVRSLEAGVETVGLRRARVRRAEWQGGVAGGPVVGERSLAFDAVLRGEFELRLGRSAGGASFVLEADGETWRGDSDRSEWSAGAAYRIDMGDGRRVALFAHRVDGDAPLALGGDGWAAGVEFAHVPGGGSRRPVPPEVAGTLSAAYGADGRHAAGIRVLVRSPPLFGRWSGVVDVDAHTLAANETVDLYYLYRVGLERPALGGRVGGAFYHRSNHRLDDAGTVTSLNVAEAGWETAGRVEAELRAGWLIDSDFGESVGWHLRGRTRVRLGARGGPFVAVEFEEGDVRRRRYAAGLRPTPHWEVELARLEDDQWFAADDEAWMVASRLRFGQASPPRRAR